eukprot:TRINITY_DN11603_c0_g1_i1.p1 TRINITY_DN11603_c0_g1~~TRINITY_DN11603_c0_g1_i1.p1  ORF type:complete len:483 (-),score=118.67 TRINITY_DN11603_c0_g1_i1:46-1494(-)
MGRTAARRRHLLTLSCSAAAVYSLSVLSRRTALLFAGHTSPQQGLALQAAARLGDQRHGLAALPTPDCAEGIQAAAAAVSSGSLDSSSLLSAFADQGQNINGILFQASLVPYLLFLYFLGYKKNNTPPLVYFGFAFLLAFVISTIPAGIISKTTYGDILANSDWLHGSSESLLTCTNILLVLGFRGGVTGNKSLAEGGEGGIYKNVAFVWLAAVVATLAAGVPLAHAELHSQLLSNAGALPVETMAGAAAEPANALSLPTWMVHWSSVFEFLVAMSLAWRYAEVSGNSKWKGLAWGMLPSHASSVCAVTFHIFYNQIPWILTAQAAFTCLGNITLWLAAMRIAVSNGWTISELNPFAEKKEESKEEEDKGLDVQVLKPVSEDVVQPGPLVLLEVVLLVTLFSYGTKYGELLFGSAVFQSPESSLAAVLFCVLPVLLTAYTIYGQSSDIQQGKIPDFALASAMGPPAPASGSSAASSSSSKGV